jgi:hypothetical protein
MSTLIALAVAAVLAFPVTALMCRRRIHAMPISSSYFRALAANFPIFVLFVAWLWHKETEPGFFGFFVALVLGFVPSLIVTLFVGMFLRTRDEMRSWSAFGLASLVGWFVLLFLALFLMPSF